MKLQKGGWVAMDEMAMGGYGCDVTHTFLEHKILRQTVLLETSMRLLSGNWALTCFKKFQVCLETQH